MSPRLLTIMGSGETSPTMIKVHRSLINQLGPGTAACFIDTPFGFQANADELTAKAQSYFAESVGTPLEVATLRSSGDPLEEERAAAVIRNCGYAFAGPGSPSYALRNWDGTPIAAALSDKLTGGGGVTFASAAALTLGAVTIPVYEIYKVGHPPEWLPGLDLLAAADLKAAVVPHYDNAEGGTHDTRYCYMGEERLAFLESTLSDETFILGVDEHTALILDLDEGTASVAGKGGVTIRYRGSSTVIGAGESTSIADLRPERIGEPSAPSRISAAKPSSWSDDFATALSEQHADRATTAALAAEAGGAERAELRQMIVALGSAADRGMTDPAEVVGPFVELLLEARAAARKSGDYEGADRIRDRLAAIGVEVRDTPTGCEWDLLR